MPAVLRNRLRLNRKFPVSIFNTLSLSQESEICEIRFKYLKTCMFLKCGALFAYQRIKIVRMQRGML